MRNEPDFILPAQAHNVDLWRSHPDVLRLAVDGDDVELWLRPLSEAELAEVEAAWLTRPAWQVGSMREPDLDIGGEGEGHPTFWDRLPRMEAYAQIEDFSDGWWAVKVWLTPACVRAAG